MRPPAFHDLLLGYRALADETREELAAAIGVSAKTIRAYERPATRRSARTPPADVFRRLCVHFRKLPVLCWLPTFCANRKEWPLE